MEPEQYLGFVDYLIPHSSFQTNQNLLSSRCPPMLPGSVKQTSQRLHVAQEPSHQQNTPCIVTTSWCRAGAGTVSLLYSWMKQEVTTIPVYQTTRLEKEKTRPFNCLLLVILQIMFI